MAQIYELSSADSLASGDLIPIFVVDDQDTRKASLSALLEYIESSANIGKLTTQYASPTGIEPNVTLSRNVHLIMTPTVDLSTSTLTLPSGPIDRDEVLVNSTRLVTTLTVSGNGKTVIGAPTTLAANGFFRMKYDGVVGAWYRVG